MVKLTKIYTRGGDKGATSLVDGTRVAKNSPRVTACGEVDETNAVIGIARLYTVGEVAEALGRIQNDLFDLGADICTPIKEHPKREPLRVQATQVANLEAAIDRINATLEPLNSFVLPGGTPAAAYLHHARSTARRAERALVALSEAEPINPEVLRYMNRLSDYLFVVARLANRGVGGDVLWVAGANRAASPGDD